MFTLLFPFDVYFEIQILCRKFTSYLNVNDGLCLSSVLPSWSFIKGRIVDIVLLFRKTSNNLQIPMFECFLIDLFSVLRNIIFSDSNFVKMYSNRQNGQKVSARLVGYQSGLAIYRFFESVSTVCLEDPLVEARNLQSNCLIIPRISTSLYI